MDIYNLARHDIEDSLLKIHDLKTTMYVEKFRDSELYEYILQLESTLNDTLEHINRKDKKKK